MYTRQNSNGNGNDNAEGDERVTAVTDGVIKQNMKLDRVQQYLASVALQCNKCSVPATAGKGTW